MKKTTTCLYLLVFFFAPFLKAQEFLNETLVYDGETRMYSIYIPASYQTATALPLMFNFHGGGGDIASQVAVSDMRPIADTADFIVVYPQALPDPNDDGSTNWLHKDPTTVDDVFFIEALLEKINSEYAIDTERVYACGYSLGGEFTYELACRLNDRIAAVGVVARTMGTAAFNSCSPVHPTGMLTILGTDDFISPYDGLVWAGIQYYLSAEETHNYWVDYNNATATPIVNALPDLSPNDGSTVERYIWSDGDGCATVEHLKVNGGGHDWPGTFGNMDIDASLEIWNYVSQYNLDGLIDCNTTSIEESAEASHFIVSPNPFSDYINIVTSLTGKQAYYLYTANGKMIRSGYADLRNEFLDLSTLVSGVYLLKVGNNFTKLIKL